MIEQKFVEAYIWQLMTEFAVDREDAVCLFQQMLATSKKMMISVPGWRLK